MSTEWEFYMQGSEAQDAMFEACLNAKKSIDFEQFIWGTDETGNQFSELLIKKAREGIHVRLLVDDGGSYDFSMSGWPAKLRAAGAEVRFFNILSPWRIQNFTSWYFRDHRKVLVVDREVGFIGGVGIRGDMRNWRDTHLSMRGEIVPAMDESFDQMWKKSEHKISFHLKKFQGRVKGFELSTNTPRYHRRVIYYHLIRALEKARDSICLTTPYFIPDHRLFSILKRAARKGISVRLLVPKLSDMPWIPNAVHSYYTPALQAGIRIFTYRNSILHAKTAVVDRVWATVGSLNLDNLSLLWNYEANIESSDQKFISEVKSQFENDLLSAEEVLLESWERRPFSQRLLEYLSLPFHRFL